MGIVAQRIRTRLGRPEKSSRLLAIVAIVMTLLIGLPILAIVVNSFNTAPLGEPASSHQHEAPMRRCLSLVWVGNRPE